MSKYKHSKAGVFKKSKTDLTKAKAAMPQIWKLQWPAPDAKPEILVSNEDSSMVSFVPVTKQMIELFGGKQKIYAIGTADPVGGLQLTSVIIGPTW